jgi:hypothetical protein
MLAARGAISKTEPLANAEFATIRERLLKLGARVIEPTSFPGRACCASSRFVSRHPDERRGVVPRCAAGRGRSNPKRVAL